MQVCTVFAQLTVKGQWQGPHVFVVRIRDDAGNLTKGVRILDNGPKMGLNGKHMLVYVATSCMCAMSL